MPLGVKKGLSSFAEWSGLCDRGEDAVGSSEGAFSSLTSGCETQTFEWEDEEVEEDGEGEEREGKVSGGSGIDQRICLSESSEGLVDSVRETKSKA